jgi:hypothetical protein
LLQSVPPDAVPCGVETHPEIPRLNAESVTALSPVDNCMLRELALRFMSRPRTHSDADSLARSLDLRFPARVLGVWMRPSFRDVHRGMLAASLIRDHLGVVTVQQDLADRLRQERFLSCPVCGVFIAEHDACWMCADVKQHAALVNDFRGCQHTLTPVEYSNVRVVDSDALLDALNGHICNIVVPHGVLLVFWWNSRLSVRCTYYRIGKNRFLRMFFSDGHWHAAYLVATEVLREAPTIPKGFLGFDCPGGERA